MTTPNDEPTAEPSVDQARGGILRTIFGWAVIVGLVAMVASFCVVTFGQLLVPGWVGEQTEAWYLGVVGGAVLALASVGGLFLVRGRDR